MCDLSSLSSLRNIGKALEEKLQCAGINTAQALKQAGSKEAFMRVKAHYPNVCLVHLMALEGAVADLEYNQLPPDVQKDLKAFNDGLK